MVYGGSLSISPDGDHILLTVKNNRLVFCDEKFKNYTDTALLKIWLYPADGNVFVDDEYHQQTWFPFYNEDENNHRLTERLQYGRLKLHFTKINLNALTEIEDEKLLFSFIDTLLEIFPERELKHYYPDYWTFLNENGYWKK